MIALVASLLLSTPATAQDLKKPELSMQMAPLEVVTRPVRFPSGLTVVLQRDPNAKFLNVVSVHTGGTSMETQENRGVSHVSEHLAFEATMGNGRVRDRLYAEGVEYDANTIQDWISYRSSGPSSALETVLEFEGQKLTNPTNGITEADLVQAKGIFGLERYYRWRGNWAAAWELLLPNLHDENSPWANIDPGEYWDGGPQVTMEMVEDFNDKVLRPDETTIAIFGPIEFDDAIATLFKTLPPEVMHPKATEEHRRVFTKPDIVDPDPTNPDHVTYWLEDPDTGELIDLNIEPEQLKAQARVDWEAPEPFPRDPDYKGEVLHINGLVDTPVAVVGWALPGTWVGHDSLKDLSATALNAAGNQSWGGMYEIELTVTGGRNAGCGNYISLRAGTIICTATARDNRVNAEELTDRLLAASSIFWNPDATFLHEQASEAGRRAALGNTLHYLEAYNDITLSLAGQTALNTHFYGDPTYTSKRMSEMMGLERQLLRPYVQAWMPEARAVAVVVDPLPKDKWLNVNPQGAYHGSLLGHTIPPTDTPPTNEEVAAAYNGPDLSKAVEKVLPNGLKVVVIQHPALPVVTVGLVARGGAAYANGLDDLSRNTTRTLWNEIYEDPTGGKQELLPDKIGAQAVFNAGADLTYEGFAAPKKNLDGALYLLRRNEMARKVRIAGKTSWWKATRMQLPRLWDSRDHWARMERIQRILPGHPLGWVLDQDSANVLKDIGAAELQAHLDRKFNPANTMLIIAGDVDVDQAMALAEQNWGSWKKTTDNPLEPLPEAPAPTGPATLWLDAGAADQTVIKASCPLPSPDGALSAAQDVLGSAIQEAFGTKLAEADAGAIASNAALNKGGNVAWLDFVAVVPHDKVSAGIDALKATAAIPTGEGFEPGRLQQHKLRAAGTQFRSMTSTRVLQQSVAQAYMLPNWGKTYFDEYGEAVASLDGEGVAKAAAGCADNLVITIEAPESSFASLKADYGAEQFDWQAKSDAELERWDKKAYKRRLKDRAKAGK